MLEDLKDKELLWMMKDVEERSANYLSEDESFELIDSLMEDSEIQAFFWSGTKSLTFCKETRMKGSAISRHYRQKIRRLGQHEAGHYVVARLLGFKADALRLKILDLNGAHLGGSGLQPVRELDTVDDIVNYLKDRVKILYAGALGESLSNGKVDDNRAIEILEKGGGQIDYAKSRELIHLIRNIRYSKTKDKNDIQSNLDEISRDLWQKSKNLIEENQNLICGLGSRLESEIKVIGGSVELNEDELETLPAIREKFHKV